MKIEIDFEVYKELTLRRVDENMSENDVIRKLLALPTEQKTEPIAPLQSNSKDWITKGVRFPEGTEFRATYKGSLYSGKIENGALLVSGERFTSPSAAAMAIASSSQNGWRFWECLIPGKTRWQQISTLKK